MSYDEETKQRLLENKKTKHLVGVIRETTELIGSEVIWYLQNYTDESIDDKVKAITQESKKYSFVLIVFFHYIEDTKHLPVYLADTGMLELSVEMDPEGFGMYDIFASTFMALSKMEEYFRLDKFKIISRIKFRNKVLYEIVQLLT